MIKRIKENKKGFTLVELIVVLVILAILAALLIPALTGYIDKAKEKSIIAETRQAVMAAQTLVDEEYAALSLKESTESAIAIEANGTEGTVGDKKVTTAEIAKLGEVIETNIISGTVSKETKDAGKLTKLVYSKDAMTCTYENGVYTVTKGLTERSE